MTDITNVLAHFPLKKEQQAELEKVKSTPIYKVSILIELIDILKQEPKDLEHAAMLFNRAKPLAKILINSSK